MLSNTCQPAKLPSNLAALKGANKIAKLIIHAQKSTMLLCVFVFACPCAAMMPWLEVIGSLALTFSVVVIREQLKPLW